MESGFSHVFLPRSASRERSFNITTCAHDGTERRIVRSQDVAEQTACYSGKKKDHTVKNVLLVNALLFILFLSDTYGGRTHDKPINWLRVFPIDLNAWCELAKSLKRKG